MDNRGHSSHRKTAATLRHEISQHIKSWDPANQSWQGPECDFCWDLAISWGTEACTACQTAPVHVTMAFIPERGLRVTRVPFVFRLLHSQCKRGSFNQPQTLFERLKCNIRWPWNTSLPSAYPSFFSSTAWPIQGLSQTRSHCITPGLLNPRIVPAPPAAIALPTKLSTRQPDQAPAQPGTAWVKDRVEPQPAASEGVWEGDKAAASHLKLPEREHETLLPLHATWAMKSRPGSPLHSSRAPCTAPCGHTPPAAVISVHKRMDKNPKQARRLKKNHLHVPAFSFNSHSISLFLCITGALVPSAGQRSPSGASSPQQLFYTAKSE